MKNYLIKLQSRIDNHFERAIEKLNDENSEIAKKMRCSKYSVFYSDPKTSLKESKLYFLGLNPRGEKDCKKNRKQLFENIDIGYWSYVDDEPWGMKNIEKGLLK